MRSLPLFTHRTCSTRSKRSCKECPRSQQQKLEAAIDRIRLEYRRNSGAWFLGFSGGKDSSAVLRLVFTAISREARPARPVTIIYCDTGVEIPHIAQRVRRTLRALRQESSAHALPLTFRIARPLPSDTYFVRVIGRGYPPPTNKFRWCTDRLRIDPVRRVLQSSSKEPSVVLLGTRFGESLERDRALARHGSGETYLFNQKGHANTTIFAPIVDFAVEDVWSALFAYPLPKAINADLLANEYREAGAECPIIRTAHGAPCGSGRFGCWTCTVVRKDRAVASMIREGRADLEPLLQFRNWLQEMRDQPQFRCRFRRNGVPGLGPLTLGARREALRRLRAAQAKSSWSLITDREIAEIHRLWRVDRESADYRE